jgi:hypothetical protein
LLHDGGTNKINLKLTKAILDIKEDNKTLDVSTNTFLVYY